MEIGIWPAGVLGIELLSSVRAVATVNSEPCLQHPDLGCISDIPYKNVEEYVPDIISNLKITDLKALRAHNLQTVF